jgi:DNA ligase D-like protein (predicted ligase)
MVGARDEITRPPRRRTVVGTVAAPDLQNEIDHFFACPNCGQNVDRRDLGAVLHHQEPEHCPLPSTIGFVEPMLPTLIQEPPSGDDWLHEIKHDGFRTQILIEGNEVRAFTRNGFDWTERYSRIVGAAGELRCSSAILDGEAIVQDDQGRSGFSAFQGALHHRPQEVVFMGFDLLHLNGRDLRPQPLLDRRVLLQDLIGAFDPASCLQFSDHATGNGSALFEAADKLGLEGIVSKRLSSRYRSGRTRSWLKIKCFTEGEFVVIGTERIKGSPPAALLAREERGLLEYAGSAMVTLAASDRDRFWRAVEELEVERPALAMERALRAHWMHPVLKVRARFLRGEGKLRHATLQALSQ